MEDTPWLGAVAFSIGWLLREWTLPRKNPQQVCKCQCTVAAPTNLESNCSSPLLWVVIFVGLILLVAFGNTALALRFSYQATSRGLDKTVSVAVKGKATGIYGSAKGLSISN